MIIIILLLAFFLRFLFLDRFPTTISGDELTYILTAKSILATGFDPSGTVSLWQIFFFTYPPFNLPQAELPYLIIMPFVSGQLSLLLVRIPFALISVLLVYLMYIITKILFNRNVALIAAFLSAINPWFLVIGRTAYEMTPAMTFYLLGFLILLRTNGWKIFFAFPVFLLAFYSYIGTKILLFPFLVLIFIYLYVTKRNKKELKYYSGFLLLTVCFLFLFAFLLSQHKGSRLSDILLPTNPSITKKVNLTRAEAIQVPGTAFVSNKATIYLQTISERFAKSIDLSYLFFTGDNFFKIWRHGLFYVLDAFFLFFGSIFLFKRKKPLSLLLFGAVIIGLIPQAIHKGAGNFTPHITFLFPFALMIIAYGIYSFSMFFKQQKRKITIAIIALYSICAINFCFIYFTQFPVYAESDVASRIVSKYLTFATKTKQPITIYTPRPDDLFKKHLFYASRYSPNINPLLQQKEITFGNVQFLSCNERVNPVKIKGIVLISAICKQEKRKEEYRTINQIKDGGEAYKIYRDPVCSQYQLKRYPLPVQFTDFQIENLDQQHFCETFINKN